MAKVTAQQWLTKWGTNLNAASQYITNGVNNVQVAPGTSAAAAQDRMLANLTAAVTSGRWAKAVSGVSLADWKAAMIGKALPRIPQGVSSAQKNATQTITNLLAAVDNAAGAARAIPKGGLQQSIARASAFMTAMAQSKGTIKA